MTDPMYSLSGYGSMIADRVRVEAYAEALRKTVRNGDVVLEIGTGPGIFAVVACQLGARQVYAIEPGEIIQVAREIAAANGCTDKIKFFEEISTRVTLPVRADVIFSDLRGVLPLFERHIPAIVDARRRFLAPGGTLIPQQDTLWAAIAEAPKPYGELVDPWEQNPFGQDLSLARQLVVNNFRGIRVSRNQLLTAHQLWTTLDYGSVEDQDARSTLNWKVERAGTAHGVLVWFDTQLVEGIGFSNAPGTPEGVYGSLFFPWTQPVSLEPGQAVSVRLEAKLVDNDYVWRWSTRIEPREDSSDSAIHFEQSQLIGAVLSVKKLHRTAANYVPHLSDEGRLRLRAFELMDGIASLEGIAQRLLKEFPERFPGWEQALSYASAISQDYSQ
jgi:type I protein arginine methyltransferase